MQSSIQTYLTRTRRRVFLRNFLNTLLLAGGIACLLSVIWIQVQPLVTEPLPEWHRQAVLIGSLSLATLFAIYRSIRLSPTSLQTALLIDQRFDLRERLTTALALDETLQKTEPGQALLQDAAQRVSKVNIADKFPIHLDRKSWMLPIPAAILACLALLYDPLFSETKAESNTDKKLAETKEAPWEKVKNPEQQKKRLVIPDLSQRKKSEKLEKLEALAKEVDKLYSDPEYQKNKLNPEKAREGFEKATELQEKLKQMEAEKHDQIKRMQEQLQQLSDRKMTEQMDGPGKEAMQALKTGDFGKAKEEFEKLKKKIKNGELSQEDVQKLKRQIEEMAKKSKEMTENKKEQDKLKKMIDQAKKEGRNAESLQRELKKLEDQSEKLNAMKDMAKKMNEMKMAMDKNDMDELAQKMSELGDQFGDLSEEVKDIEALDESLEEIRKFRKSLAGKAKGDGDSQPSDEVTESDDYDGDRGGVGAGRRKINENAKSNSEQERVRVQFDPTGKKRYVGSTDGPAFTKKSTVELEGEIKEAAQDAADSLDVQKLPKGARDTVKEYMERLGDQAPKSEKK